MRARRTDAVRKKKGRRRSRSRGKGKHTRRGAALAPWRGVEWNGMAWLRMAGRAVEAGVTFLSLPPMFDAMMNDARCAMKEVHADYATTRGGKLLTALEHLNQSLSHVGSRI